VWDNKFAPSIFKSTLRTVSKERRTPSSIDTAETLRTTNQSPRLEVALVESRINLSTTFDQIQRCHSGVSYTLRGPLAIIRYGEETVKA
jgi:hypothetical protein